MKTPNYHDFYQKALIPIGFNDLLALNEIKSFEVGAPATHWLIAVEGVQLSQAKIYFQWKVSVYPSNCNGDFNWKKPFYCSPIMESMDSAHDIACSIVALSKQDQLSAFNLEEKIS
ncbi:hypothetical protein [Neobacillus vireti]|uniref:hypothetical protein n=1 Tax=Neobacillus vireti TaxID=220686 RepID=UPI0030006493